MRQPPDPALGLPADCPSSWVNHSQILLDSFRKWLGYELWERAGSPLDQASGLFHANFVVVSHDTQPDPILTYGNRCALDLWEMDVATLLTMASRLTAEPLHREERARLLARTARNGFVDDYQGVRISSSGRRFRIRQAIVWNLQDPAGRHVGQAATFGDWLELPGPPGPS